MKLKEIDRTATFAWSPNNLRIATGTVAGTVDADFSSSSQLEIWDVDLLDRSSEGFRLTKPAVSISADTRFHDLVWHNTGKHSLIVGATESGALEVWEADDITSSSTSVSVKEHSGPIKTLQFDPHNPTRLVSGGTKGEIFVWDLSDPKKPTAKKLGTDNKAADIESLAFNNITRNILATSSSKGITTIWNVDQNKELTRVKHDKPVSHVAWHPSKPTKLITAVADDAEPVMLIWDLKNANAPEAVLQGHSKGILSVDWCQLDPRFLLSCGKDNRTLLWNPDTHECLGEYGAAQNWTFKTKLNDRTPDLFATASFEGKIVIQTLQDVNGGDAPAQEGDFFQNLGTQSQAKISLKQAPSWLQRPVSNSFGFGGKIVIVTTADGKSTVKVGKFVGDKVDTESIEVVLKGDLSSAFDKVKGAEWKVLEALSKGTEEVRSFLDIPVKKEEPTVEDDSEDVFSKMSPSGAFSLESSDPINQAIINGNLSTAVDLCLKEDRLLDAFALAEKASDAVKAKVQNAYFAKQTSSTARLLNAVNTNKLDDVVENADLKDWKEILALLYTYGGAQFGDLAAALGDRLRESDRDNALTCYLVSGKLDKVSALWESEITTREKELTKDKVAPYTAHFSALKEFIEKISVFRKATNAVDSGSVDGLYNKYREFANIVASQGNLELAQQFLALLPASFEGVGLERERLNKAAKPSVAAAATTKTSAYGKPAYGAAAPQASAYTPAAPAYGSMYAPAAPVAASPAAPPPPSTAAAVPPSPAKNMYTPQPPAPVTGAAPAVQSPGAPQHNAYSPYNPQPQTNAYAPQGNAYGAAPQQNTYGRSTPGGNVRTTAPRHDTAGYNDLPAGSVPPPKKSAPSPGPIQSAYAPPTPAAPSAPPVGGPRPPSVNRVTSPGVPSGGVNAYGFPIGGGHVPSPYGAQAAYGARPPVPAVTSPPPPNPYAPAHSPAQSNAQPAANPYAPAPGAVVSPPPVHAGIVPPVAQRSAPSNPYAPAPGAGAPPASNPYAPPTGGFTGAPAPHAGGGYTAPPPAQVAPPPAGPPRNNVAPPPGGAARNPVPSSPAPPPAASKHPAGDRTHIPATSRPIFDTLSTQWAGLKPLIPEQYSKHVRDAEKRLNILYDHLNNDDAQPEMVEDLLKLSNAIAQRDFPTAQALQLQIATARPDECGKWMVGLKRFVEMAAAVKNW